jgi:hypothetical protein
VKHKATLAGGAVIAATSFLAFTQIGESSKDSAGARTSTPVKTSKVRCKSSSIHATVTADGKGYVLTSATVCTNGKLTLSGKEKP